MSYELYKILHIVGLSLVTLSLGGVAAHVINGGTKASNTWRKGTMITHGIGLVLLFVAGFGMLAKLGIRSFPLWVVGKIVVWLVLGAAVAVLYRKPHLSKVMWIVIPLLVGVATVLAVTKPGSGISAPVTQVPVAQ